MESQYNIVLFIYFLGRGGVQLTGQLNKGIRNKIEVTGSWKDQKKKTPGITSEITL